MSGYQVSTLILLTMEDPEPRNSRNYETLGDMYRVIFSEYQIHSKGVKLTPVNPFFSILCYNSRTVRTARTIIYQMIDLINRKIFFLNTFFYIL